MAWTNNILPIEPLGKSSVHVESKDVFENANRKMLAILFRSEVLAHFGLATSYDDIDLG